MQKKKLTHIYIYTYIENTPIYTYPRCIQIYSIHNIQDMYKIPSGGRAAPPGPARPRGATGRTWTAAAWYILDVFRYMFGISSLYFWTLLWN